MSPSDVDITDVAALDRYLQDTLSQCLEAAGTTQGSLMLLNRQEKMLEIVRRCGPDFDLSTKYRRFKLGEGVAGWVAQSGSPFLTGDVSKEELFKPPKKELNFRSLLAVPILDQNQVIGVACADSRDYNRFRHEHAQALNEITRHIGPVIQTLHLETYISRAKRLRQLESLHQMGQDLSALSFRSPAEILSRIAKEAERVLEADLVTLYEYQEKASIFRTPPEMSGAFRYPRFMVCKLNPTDAPARIVTAGRARYSEDSAADKFMRAKEIVPATEELPQRPSFVDREEVASSVGIPLKAGQETVGVMFVNYRTRHPFPDDERHVIEIFAAYAALAIQVSRRVEEEAMSRQVALMQSTRMVAHKLRNILPIISGCLAPILSRKLSRYVRDRCLEAIAESQRAQRVVDDFDTFAKAEVYECPDKLSGKRLLGALGRTIRRSLREAGTLIDERVARGRLPTVQVSLDRLQDDFVGFVRDSERHNPEGLHLALVGQTARPDELRAVGLPVGKRFLKIIYTDNGPGIPQALKRTVFEPFFTTCKGSGLGLSIAGHNAKVHGGVLVETGDRHGARFELFLPEA